MEEHLKKLREAIAGINGLDEIPVEHRAKALEAELKTSIRNDIADAMGGQSDSNQR